VPLPFLKRRRRAKPVEPIARRPAVGLDDLTVHDNTIRLQYHALSSDGLRVRADPLAMKRLPELLDGLAHSEVEIIEPVALEFKDAAPTITRPASAEHWINAHRSLSPIGRHALFILETLDAIDLAYETFALGLLHGDVDGEGFPRFDALVGGPVSYWDESSGDLIARMVVAWGGEGARSDIERTARRLIGKLMSNLVASQGEVEVARTERRVAVAGTEQKPCPHCGFNSLDKRSFYCPKCGMRIQRD
jgi:predicted RNA-binding Zn-ribbon protein involved in translation (DUF1610 family)